MAGMRIYGELYAAQLQNLASDPTAGKVARFHWNTTEGRAKYDTGAAFRAFLANDEKCVIGLDAVSGNNIRLHRGASAVLQFVIGSDSTTDGTLATSIAQISSRVENYATGSLPASAAGNEGRLLWDSSLHNLKADNGSAIINLMPLTTKGDIRVYSGGIDTRFGVGSDGQVLTADSSQTAGIKWATPATPGASTPWSVNLGLSYASHTLSLTGADQNALAAGNAAYITIPSKTYGKMKVISITAPQSFVDATGTSQIAGNLFGTTTGRAWGSACPFFLYACLDNTEAVVTFGISRVPNLTAQPAAGNIGTPSSAVASTQGSMFLFSSVTVANYAGNPCVCIGSFRMTKSSGDDWTVTTLSDQDGIGRYQETAWMTFPTGQNGADSGAVCIANGGTSPIFTTTSYIYKVEKDGTCRVDCYLTGDGGTDGSGAVVGRVALPFKATVTGGLTSQAVGVALGLNPSFSDGCIVNVDDSQSYFYLNRPTGLANVTWANYSNGSRSITGQFAFRMSTA